MASTQDRIPSATREAAVSPPLSWRSVDGWTNGCPPPLSLSLPFLPRRDFDPGQREDADGQGGGKETAWPLLLRVLHPPLVASSYTLHGGAIANLFFPHYSNFLGFLLFCDQSSSSSPLSLSLFFSLSFLFSLLAAAAAAAAAAVRLASSWRRHRRRHRRRLCCCQEGAP